MYNKNGKIGLFKADNGGLFHLFRITFLFLLATIGFIRPVSAQTAEAAKTITLNVQNRPIKEVLTLIERQSDYIFVYYDNILDIHRKVTLKVTNQPCPETVVRRNRQHLETLGKADRHRTLRSCGRSYTPEDHTHHRRRQGPEQRSAHRRHDPHQGPSEHRYSHRHQRQIPARRLSRRSTGIQLCRLQIAGRFGRRAGNRRRGYAAKRRHPRPWRWWATACRKRSASSARSRP